MPFFLLPIIKIARKIVNIPSRQNREIKYEEGSTVFRDYERVKRYSKDTRGELFQTATGN